MTPEQKILKVIEWITAEAQRMESELKSPLEKEFNRIICDIYELTHTINSPDCQKNHPKWTEKFNDYIKWFDEEQAKYSNVSELPFGWNHV